MDELRADLAWIKERVGDRPFGCDITLPSSYVQGNREELEEQIPEVHREFVEDLMREHEIPEPKTPGPWGTTRLRSLADTRAKLELFMNERIPIFASGLGSPAFILDELHEAVRGCRFIALATPLTPETEGMINADSIAAMDDDAVIVNVARGHVIDREALIAALRRGKLSTAGIDVFWEEPVDPADPLFDYEVFVTPHASNACDAFVRETSAGVAENVRRLIAGEPLLWEARAS